MDERVVGVHQKRYTLREVLRTDFLRARGLMLMRLRKWGRKFYTSVPAFYQIAVPTLFVAIGSLGLTLIHPIFFIAGILLLFTFYVLFFPWLAYLTRERGIRFGIVAGLFQLIDVMVVGLGMLKALIEFARGTRY